MDSGIKSRIVYEVSRVTNFPVSYFYDKGKHVPFLFFPICKRFDIVFSTNE